MFNFNRRFIMISSFRHSLLTICLALAASITRAETVVTKIKTVTVDELNAIMTTELQNFMTQFGEPPAGYVMPVFEPAQYDVDIYRVAYDTAIPDRNNRPTRAYGMLAIPRVEDSSTLPLLSYQHGTIFGKFETPSYAFVPKEENPQYDGAYENRIVVARFAGSGYAVIAADYIGLGDSTEPDGYTVKASHQRACLDMLNASRAHLSGLGIETPRVLLAGWSQGGFVTMALLEKIEMETDIEIAAVATAAAPCDLFAALNGVIYHPRPLDAPWINTIVVYTALAYESYYGWPASKVIRAEHLDACRALYNRAYANSDEFAKIMSAIPVSLSDLLLPEFADSNHFSRSDYGRQLYANTAYRWMVKSSVRMYYGTRDEVISVPVAVLPERYQEAMGNGGAIESIQVELGNHRGTFIQAISQVKPWFDAKSR
jgi:pimeloyl-ACP methyl ester carboxylesterase